MDKRVVKMSLTKLIQEVLGISPHILDNATRQCGNCFYVAFARSHVISQGIIYLHAMICHRNLIIYAPFIRKNRDQLKRIVLRIYHNYFSYYKCKLVAL